MSESLCVKSSSLLSPVSRVMEGRTVTDGTSKSAMTAHSGLQLFGLIPIFRNSSSFIATKRSLASIGLSLFLPIIKVLGFSSLTLSNVSEQCGHFFASLAFLARMLGGISFCFSSVIVSFPQCRQKLRKHSSMRGMYLIWNTGRASSMLPECPKHSLNLCPHVRQRTP